MEIRITFRAKRDKSGEYRVPEIKPHHIDTPENTWDTKVFTALQGKFADERIHSYMLEQGISTGEGKMRSSHYLDANTPHVTVTPDRSGFMATVTFVVQI